MRLQDILEASADDYNYNYGHLGRGKLKAKRTGSLAADLEEVRHHMVTGGVDVEITCGYLRS